MKTDLPDTVGTYLTIRNKGDGANTRISQLLQELAGFEKHITDRDQRKQWHAMRAKIIKARKIMNSALNNPKGEK